MTTFVGDITYGELQPIKFSGLGTSGILCSLMSVKNLELVINVINLLGNNS
jgi:hypothetical protein